MYQSIEHWVTIDFIEIKWLEQKQINRKERKNRSERAWSPNGKRYIERQMANGRRPKCGLQMRPNANDHYMHAWANVCHFTTSIRKKEQKIAFISNDQDNG